MADRLTEEVEIGYVARAHGVRGELRVVCHDPESQTLFEVDRVSIGGEWFEVAGARPTNGAVLVALRGVADRDQAEALRGAPVAVAREELELGDEVLLADLVGCRVELDSGESWGEVVAIEQGPQDRLVIHGDGQERLLPVVDELIVDIDLEAGVIVASVPEEFPFRALGADEEP